MAVTNFFENGCFRVFYKPITVGITLGLRPDNTRSDSNSKKGEFEDLGVTVATLEFPGNLRFCRYIQGRLLNLVSCKQSYDITFLEIHEDDRYRRRQHHAAVFQQETRCKWVKLYRSMFVMVNNMSRINFTISKPR